MSEDKKANNKVPVEVVAAAAAFLGLLTIGTITFHWLERWSWISSFYFTIVTLATVGYGDLTPTNDGTRLFTAVFIMFGASITVASLGIIGTRYLERRGVKIAERRERKRD